MKIFFDVSTLNPQKITGVGVYMLQLLRHFNLQNDVTVIPSVKLSRFKNKQKIETLLPQYKCKTFLPFKLFSEAGSLYHGPDFKLNIKGPLKRVVTIHDMVVFEEQYNKPEFYKKGIHEMTKVLNSSLDAVIVNSEFTKSQVLRFFPQLKNKIHVTYLGCDRNKFVSSNRVSQNINLPQKYILFLGTLEKRKNVLGVIRAFEILKSRGFNQKLVLAGAWGFGSDEIKMALENSPVKEHIIHLNYVSDNDLPELYQRADVFFFPSWYEGFGIPVLEAMSLGCPVVTSAGGALQEVCGEAAVFTNPANPDAAAQALGQILSDRDLQSLLREKGLVRAQSFTWQKCADETIQVYKKVLSV
ncbi:MAG: glycosyltransferase family 4 protein [Bdellovibrio sp.]